MKYKQTNAAWSSLRGGKGALSGNSTAKFQKVRNSAVATKSMMGSSSVISHRSNAKNMVGQLKHKSRLRGF